MGTQMMLSRVADHLYWMGRYLERAEHALRLLKVSQDMRFDLQMPDIDWTWQRIVYSLQLTLPEDADEYERIRQLVLDPSDSSSIFHSVNAARDNARQVREQISTEMWEQLNRLYINLRDVDLEAEWDAGIFDFYQQQLRELHTFEGITYSTLSHGVGWRFLQIGRLIERAINTVMLLHFYAANMMQADATRQQYLSWVMLLRDCTAFEAYCKVYSADLRFPQIVDFLLFNADFPHAIHHAIASLQISLDHIADTAGTPRSGMLYRLIGRLSADLRYADKAELLSDNQIADTLSSYLDNVRSTCDQIHAVIYDTYIGYPIDDKLPSQT